MSTETLKRATLRANVASFSAVEVDTENGIIRNASVMTIGPALGHGFELDQTSLKQLVETIGDGVQVRFKHPSDPMADSLGTDVGVVKNVHIDGNQVRGDVHLGAWAKNLPGIGDAWTYLLTKAQQAPASFGLSAVIDYEVEPVSVGGPPRLMARIYGTEAVDFVGKPAANPSGLLSAAPEKPSMPYDPKYRAACEALGMPSTATDEQAAAFFAALPPEKQAACAVPPTPTPEISVETETPVTPPVAPAAMSARPEMDVVALETKRVSQIKALAAILPNIGEEQINLAIADPTMDANKARTAFLAHIAQNAKPVRSISVGEDRGVAALNKAIPDALRIRAGVNVKDAHEMAHKLAGLSALEQFRRYLIGHGVNDAMYFTPAQLSELFTNRRKRASLAQSTSDFDNVLLDAANKTLRNAYQETPTLWSKWARKNTNPDFKAGNRIMLSEAGMPVLRNEGAELKYNTLTDSKIAVTLNEYVNGIKLTRRAIVNDDLSAFNRVPTLLGASYKRLEDYLAFSVLTANATLASTGGALFNSTALTSAAGHANLISSGGAAPSVTTLAATSALLRKQKGLKKTTADDAGAYLNTQPVAIIVPVALEVTAAQLIGSNVDPSKSNSTTNPYFNKLEVVSHPLLDANSATAWYLAADPNLVDGVEVCFLQDEQSPVLKNETDFDTDDVKFASRHTVTAAAIDYRGLAKNPGV